MTDLDKELRETMDEIRKRRELSDAKWDEEHEERKRESRRSHRLLVFGMVCWIVCMVFWLALLIRQHVAL